MADLPTKISLTIVTFRSKLTGRLRFQGLFDGRPSDGSANTIFSDALSTAMLKGITGRAATCTGSAPSESSGGQPNRTRFPERLHISQAALLEETTRR